MSALIRQLRELEAKAAAEAAGEDRRVVKHRLAYERAVVTAAPLLLAVVEAAQTGGVQYALKWMREGRRPDSPTSRDIDALVAALAALEQEAPDAQ